jgi:hypothetical protein
VSGDSFENDESFTTSNTITVGAGGQTHTFHSALDVDHVKFTTSSQGAYVVRTSNMVGGAQTIVSILDSSTGGVVADPLTGSPLTAFADLTTGELGAARVTFSVSGANVSRTFVIRITNASPDNYGTSTSYQVRVDQVAFTATPTPVPNAPTNTSTPTVTPTRTPAAGDVYESDNTKAAADALPYTLFQPISHAGIQGLTTDRQTGPAHTFNVQGDEDWLAIQLPAIVPNSQLVIRAYDVTRRGEQRTQPQMFLYRINPGNGELQLLRRVENCTDIGGQPTGSCLTMSFPSGQATLYSGQTFYLRIRNLTSTFYGSDVGYSLDVHLNAPAVVNTSTPTATRTARPSTGTPVVGTPTLTATPTARPVEQQVNPNRGGSYRNENGDTDGDAPRYFTTGHDDGVDLSFHSSQGLNDESGSSDPLAQRRQAPRRAMANDGLRSLRIVVGDAMDTVSGDRISEFVLPFGFCIRYTLADLDSAGVRESTLAPYYLDPLTGERKTLGVVRTSFTAATATTPGEICFKTTHFTDFSLSGDAVPTATPSAPTPTGTPRSGSGFGPNITLFRLSKNSGGW